jgi:hypothetical protein
MMEREEERGRLMMTGWTNKRDCKAIREREEDTNTQKEQKKGRKKC